MTAHAGDALVARLLAFGRLLRRLDLEVHVGRMMDVVEALPHVDVGRRDDVFHLCRALLVHRHEDLEAFDRAFDRFWSGSAEAVPGAPAAGRGDASGVDRADASRDSAGLLEMPIDRDDLERTDPIDVPSWSDAEALATKDFAEFSESELTAARAAIARMQWQPGVRRTRRWVPGRGSRLDLRRALRQSVRTGGDMTRLPRRVRRLRPRPIVLLCDVSGSMELYSRLLVHFSHALTRRHRRVETFLFSTRLTRITRHLRRARIDDAVRAVSRAVPDWSGGTRIGASLAEFQRRWGRRVLVRGPVVLLVSDGWDRGDPALLAAAISRLHRSCHRLIWLNPLVGTQDYQPLTRGLVAALPHVDDFLPARSLQDLASLAALLDEERRSRPGRKGAPRSRTAETRVSRATRVGSSSWI